MDTNTTERDELRAFLLRGFRAPGWYAQMRIAQTLHCPPWEAFPEDTTPREVWVGRAIVVLEEEAKAQEHYRKRARAAGRRSGSFPLTDAVARQDFGPPTGKVTFS